jgi:hypothetical protein
LICRNLYYRDNPRLRPTVSRRRGLSPELGLQIFARRNSVRVKRPTDALAKIVNGHLNSQIDDRLPWAT